MEGKINDCRLSEVGFQILPEERIWHDSALFFQINIEATLSPELIIKMILKLKFISITSCLSIPNINYYEN